ncbi:FAD:protein FMN transferase [Cytophaga sp. FL35]|uniref:FAD:protein FMN transferase n=1 Tax=Cytophaga sp. FL35 TaxID=1904456 RepID=UPI002570269A|nr:FAD:protein FMN transferase [Cytophaga sp. FL35]
MKKRCLYFLFLITTLGYSQQNYQRTLKLMGSRFDITVVANDSVQGAKYIDFAIAEIERIETLISSWDSQSQTSLINKNAGKRAVSVHPELWQLIKRSLDISQVTDGAFDITYASMDRIWDFNNPDPALPSAEDIRASVSKVGFKKVKLDKEKHTVFLKENGMKIGFGAIGKGYAADMAKKLLMKQGVSGGIINASGDMNTWGQQANGKPWKIALTNPLNKNQVFVSFNLKEEAVVTSGNYEKFKMLDGKRYSHIIDPRSGWPASGLASVTIFAPQAELADALATAVFVMGKETGLNLIQQIPKVKAIIIDDQGSIFTSKNIEIDRTWEN